jgi:hypothetical protein
MTRVLKKIQMQESLSMITETEQKKYQFETVQRTRIVKLVLDHLHIYYTTFK